MLRVIPALGILITLQLCWCQHPHIEVTDSGLVKKGLKSNLGVVYGTKQCGGEAELVQWRVQDCNTTDSPCNIPVDGNLRNGELDIIPTEDIDQLGFRILVQFSDKVPIVIHEKLLRNTTVKGGEINTVGAERRIKKEMKGSSVIFRWELYRPDEDKTLEACAEAPFNLV